MIRLEVVGTDRELNVISDVIMRITKKPVKITKNAIKFSIKTDFKAVKDLALLIKYHGSD